jgi:hypothetical protein
VNVRCEFCGKTVERRHHPTGKDHRNRYLDPELVVPVCHDDHELVHDDWRTLAIEAVAEPQTFVEQVEIRLRRLAATLARWDEALGGGTFLNVLAAALTGWADELAAFLRRLDTRDPTWREDPGFYPER